MAAHRCSSFAQEQLEKHGWKSGQGLGKSESGISEAIKVKIKQDTAGVGHDPAEQFTYHWWDHVFNKAASNIVVETDDQEGVKLSRKEALKGPISNKKQSVDRGKKPLLYGNFVKSATLTTEGLQQDNQDPSSSSSDEDSDSGNPKATNIDERFYKACGGRTAHKGARHGLTLSGKLRRIQAQEEGHHLPRPPKEDNDVHGSSASQEGSSEERNKKRRKKDKKRSSKKSASGTNLPSDQIVNGERDCKKRKKCKKAKADYGDLEPHAYSLNGNPCGGIVKEKQKGGKMLEKEVTNNDEYSLDGFESKEQILEEAKTDKAARKKAKKAKRTREKRRQEVESTVCEEDGDFHELGNREMIRQPDQFVPNEFTNGHVHSPETHIVRKSKKKKSKHNL